ATLLDTTTDLLAPGVDYYSRPDDVRNPGWNRSGVLIRTGLSSWGVSYRRPVGDLGFAVEAERGAVFISGQVGPASVSSTVQ
ncbi:hypothetical protein, partial [Olsenella uli]|uniref:hypothetical protein n=1 Tax=Olsenella uli TaxID=133926 RepID=UPI001957F884